MYSEDLEALEVTVRAMEAKLREIRACIQREQAAIPKARLIGTPFGSSSDSSPVP